MRKYLILVAFLAPSLMAQEATLNTPISRNSVAKIKIANFICTRAPNQCVIDVVYQDSSNVDILDSGLPGQYTVPSNAGAPCTSSTALIGTPSLLNSMNVVRATETGNAARIQQFRILGYLSDRGCLTGVTLVP